MQAFAERLRGDRPLMLLPMQHVLGPSPMQQILLARPAIHPPPFPRRRVRLGSSRAILLPAPFRYNPTTRDISSLRIW